MTAGGIFPSRSIASESTFSARKRSIRSMNARNSGRSGGFSRERVDEVEAEVAEEDLLEERGRLPLALARFFGDLAGLVGADGLRGSFCHGIGNFTTGGPPLRAAVYSSRGYVQQIPVLRRKARAEGAGDVLPAGVEVRPRQRRHELRDAPELEAADGAPGAVGRPPGARVLDLCCGSGDLCFLAERFGAGPVTGADFTLPMLAVAPAPHGARAAAGADSSRPTRSSSPFATARSTSSRSATACATSRTSTRPSRRCAACSRPEAARWCWTSASPTAPSPAPSTRLFSGHDDAGRGLALSRRPRDLPLHPRVARSAFRRSAASSG